MPSETDSRRKVFSRVGQRLSIVAEPGVNGQVRVHMNAVLNEAGQKPLRQLIAADPKIDWLRVVLHVRKRQLAEGRRRRALERECAEDCRARLASGASGGVMDHAPTEAQIVLAKRPGQRIRELNLVTEDVGRS